MLPKFFASMFLLGGKIKSPLIVGFLIFLLVIGACQRPEEIDLSPKLVLVPQGESGFLRLDDTLFVKVRLLALDGFQSFRIQEVSTGVLFSLEEDEFPDTTVIDTTFMFPMDPYSLRDTLKYEFFVSDGKSRKASNFVQVIIDQEVDSLYENFSSPYVTNYNSYYSSSYDTGFTLEEAGLISEKIDLGFDYISDYWLVASPADSFFSQVLVPEMSGWSTLNPTMLFSTDKNRSDFIDLGSDGPILETFITPVQSIDSLDEGQVLSFLTVDSLAGWILIDKINEDFDSKDLFISASIKIGR